MSTLRKEEADFAHYKNKRDKLNLANSSEQRNRVGASVYLPRSWRVVSYKEQKMF